MVPLEYPEYRASPGERLHQSLGNVFIENDIYDEGDIKKNHKSSQ